MGRTVSKRPSKSRVVDFDHVLLVDNGSLRPEAIRAHRRIARKLSLKLGRKVEPVSVLHSNAVSPDDLGGRAAEILEPALRKRALAGGRKFLVLPLYLGRSATLVNYIPAVARRLREDFPRLGVRVADHLGARCGYDLRPILRDLTRAKLTPGFKRGVKPTGVVVDHGSPSLSVKFTRDHLWGQTRAATGNRLGRMQSASMERRPGPKYAFNEPLLENLLNTEPFNFGPVLVVMLFILPGRHAGPDGDIAQICRRAEARNPGLRTVRTELIGSHPKLIDVLARRFRDAS